MGSHSAREQPLESPLKDWSSLTGRRSRWRPARCNPCLNVPSAKALPRIQLVVRSTAQPDVINPRVAQLCPRLNVVELEQCARLTSSPGLRHERASRVIPRIHRAPHRRRDMATPLAPLREAHSDPRDFACSRIDRRSFTSHRSGRRRTSAWRNCARRRCRFLHCVNLRAARLSRNGEASRFFVLHEALEHDAHQARKVVLR
jgi:hypothetical protein